MESRSPSPSIEEQQPFIGRVPGPEEIPAHERQEVYFEIDPQEVDIANGDLLPESVLAQVDLIAKILEENDGCETHRLAFKIIHDDEEAKKYTLNEILNRPHSNNDPEEPEPQHVHRPNSKWRFLMYTFPAADALFDATQTAIGLSQGPWSFNAPVSLINFFSTFGLNAKFGVSGTEDLIFVIKNIRNPKIPSQWNERDDHTIDERLSNLSRGHEITAFTLAAIMTSFAAIADSIQCYFFLKELPKELGFENSKYFYKTPWSVFGGAVAGLEALSVITSEGAAVWKESRALLAGVRKEYRTLAGKYIGRGLGVPLGLGDSVRDGLLSYIGIMYIFEFNSVPAKVMVGIWAAITGVCNYSTNGPNIIDHFDRFFAAFTTDEEGVVQAKDPKNIISLLLSGVAGTLFGYAQHKMIEEEVSKLSASFNLEVPLIITAISYWCFATISVNSAGNLFDLMYLLVNTGQKGAGWLYDKIRNGTCCNRNDPLDPDVIATERYMEENNLLADFEVIVDDLENSAERLDQALATQQKNQRAHAVNDDFFEPLLDDEMAIELNSDDFEDLSIVIDPLPANYRVEIPLADKSRLFRSQSMPDLARMHHEKENTGKFTP